MTQQYDNYLGFLPLIRRAKRMAFLETKSRVWQKLQTWKEKLLSQGGKEVLLKVVALSNPTYADLFQTIGYTLLQIESLMARLGEALYFKILWGDGLQVFKVL